MTKSELIAALQALDVSEDTRLMLGVKPLTGQVALLARREPWDDDVLIWDGSEADA